MRPLWSPHPVRRFDGDWEPRDLALPEEVPVALVFDGATQAVMMASPGDLEDFIRGFALTEGLVADAARITRVEIVDQGAQGIEARAWLTPGTGAALAERRRSMVGPVGCGLCGIDSLTQALRVLPMVPPSALRLGPGDPARAMAALEGAQPLQDATRAAHAAAFWHPEQGLVALREDIGRHNALDKLAGALLARGTDVSAGVLVLTSRLSVDMVQKAAMIGAPVVIAASAPTSLALASAEAAGLTLISRARGARFDLHTHPERMSQECPA
jgi:FdhD protein